MRPALMNRFMAALLSTGQCKDETRPAGRHGSTKVAQIVTWCGFVRSAAEFPDAAWRADWAPCPGALDSAPFGTNIHSPPRRRLMTVVDRVKNICLTPNTEWPVIAGEPASPASLITGYVAPLAAIGAVA